MAYELIETIEVGAGGAASIEFTSIPQDGVDLLCVYSGRNTATSFVARIQLNSDTGSNYSMRSLYGGGSSAASDSASGTYFSPFSINPSSYTANTFGNSQLYISNYTSSSNKSVSMDSVIENNATTSYQHISAGLYSDTAAITSIKIFTAANLAEFSTASLYIIS